MSEVKSRYCVRYRDADPCCPIFTWYTRAYNAEHAVDRFHESDDDGWVIVGVAKVAD